METQLSQVIVTTQPNSPGVVVYHRDFPEIRSQAGSPREAATHLVNKLAAALDSALIDWRRERVDQALADVKAFLETQA